ncbi:MAG: hypothetical protein LBB81_06765 [Treponema sp.]|nr:hypothetical protein [Treponema sp.]
MKKQICNQHSPLLSLVKLVPAVSPVPAPALAPCPESGAGSSADPGPGTNPGDVLARG